MINNDSITTVDAEQFKNSVFLTLGMRGLSFKKQVRNQDAIIAYFERAKAEADAKKAAGEEVDFSRVAVPLSGGLPKGKAGKALTSSKALLFSPALDALREHLSATKAKITSPPQYGGLANPSGIMEGLFELHKALVPQVNALIEEARRKLTEPWTETKDGETIVHPGYLTAFLNDYAAAQERARTLPVLEGGLGPLFNASDYPTTEKVIAGFSIERRWVALGVPEGLPPELHQQAAEELKSDLRNAAEEIKAAMRTGFAELLSHAKDVLATPPGEKAKVIKESLIGNVLQFCDVFTMRNTQGDTELAALVEEARNTLAGVDPEKCRKFANVRQEAAKQFATLSAKMDEMITEQRTRKFELE